MCRACVRAFVRACVCARVGVRIRGVHLFGNMTIMLSSHVLLPAFNLSSLIKQNIRLLFASHPTPTFYIFRHVLAPCPTKTRRRCHGKRDPCT